MCPVVVDGDRGVVGDVRIEPLGGLDFLIRVDRPARALVVVDVVRRHRLAGEREGGTRTEQEEHGEEGGEQAGDGNPLDAPADGARRQPFGGVCGERDRDPRADERERCEDEQRYLKGSVEAEAEREGDRGDEEAEDADRKQRVLGGRAGVRVPVTTEREALHVLDRRGVALDDEHVDGAHETDRDQSQQEDVGELVGEPVVRLDAHRRVGRPAAPARREREARKQFHPDPEDAAEVHAVGAEQIPEHPEPAEKRHERRSADAPGDVDAAHDGQEVAGDEREPEEGDEQQAHAVV